MDFFDASDAASNDEVASGGSISISGQPQQLIRSISVKTPVFSKSEPKLWFFQMEAHFQMNRVTSDRTKYNSVIASLDSSVLAQVRDVVFSPPEADMYDTLKKRVLERFADSDETRLKRLLTGLSLGDKKPSHLLRDMRDLAGTGLSEAVLKSLWLKHLPNQCQAILSVSNEPVESLALLADKICEVSLFESCSLSSTSESINEGGILAQLKNLSVRFENLEKKFSTLPSSRTSFRNKSRSNSRARSDSRSGSSNSGMCWYHRTFADRASKCLKPCGFSSSSNSEN